jgi:hypothetical protein
MSEEQEQKAESKQIRVFDDRIGVLRSGSTNGHPNIHAQGHPYFETGIPDSNREVKVITPPNNIYDAWWFEDFYNVAKINNIKSLDDKRTIDVSKLSDGGNIGGTNYIFNSKTGGTSNTTIANGKKFDRSSPGQLQFGVPSGETKTVVTLVMGTVSGETSKLNNKKAVFDYPLGMSMSVNTGGSDVPSNDDYRFEHLSILYKHERSSDIRYGAIVENHSWTNPDRLVLAGQFSDFDPTDNWGKNKITPGWTQKPKIGGEFSGFINEDEINIIESQPGWRAVGMVMGWAIKGEQALNFFDIKPIFHTGDGLPATKSRRLIQPPQLYSETFDIDNFKLV